MRPFNLVIALAILLISYSCDKSSPSPKQSSNSSPESTAQTPRVPSEDFSFLRRQHGGYLRPPKNKRVIVFVNGIFGDAVSTWENSGKYWPKLLLADSEFKDVDIYVHSFDSPKIEKAETIEELAGRLRDYLDADEVFKTHEQVVFVCHSMGGLITRAYLLKARPAPVKVPMIYFFSTPTTGANIAEIAKHLSNNPQLSGMAPLKFDGYVGNLQNEWLRTSDDKSLNYTSMIASFCAYEKFDTFGIRIVERQSATNLCNRETRGIAANHIDIVKPAGDRGESYIAFKAAYGRTFGPATAAIQDAVTAQRNTPISDQIQTVDIKLNPNATLSAGDLVLKRVKATREYIEVDCEQHKSGDIVARVEVPLGQRIIEVRPTIENSSNIAESSVALVRYDGNSATVHYFLRGLDKTLFGLNCPGGGHADVVASFVLIREDQKIE